MSNNKIQEILEGINQFFNAEHYTRFSAIDESEIQKIASNGNGVITGDIEEMNRDYFYSHNSLISKLSNLDSLENSDLLLTLNEVDSDGSGYCYQLGVGNLKDEVPWIIFFDATIGEYNDTDCDVYGSYELYIGGLNQIQREVLNRTNNILNRSLNMFESSFFESIKALEKFPQEKAKIEGDITQKILDSKLGQHLFPILEKKVLNQTIPASSSSKNKSKKTL